MIFEKWNLKLFEVPFCDRTRTIIETMAEKVGYTQ